MRRVLCGLMIVALACSMMASGAPAAKAAGSTWQVSACVPNAHGALTPALQEVTDGGSAVVLVSPIAGYHLVSLTDNGEAVSPLPVDTYVIAAVTEDHIVGAVFGQDGLKETVTLAEEGFPENLFPLIADSAYTAKASSYIMASTIGVTPRGELYADLCSTVPTQENGDLVRNPDGTAITTVRLRAGLKWSDGQPLTIDDYIFSHELYMSDAIHVVSRTPMDLVTLIERIDDLTCRVTWSRWDPFIPTGWSIYPKHILGPIFDTDPAAINTCDYAWHAVHAGPYVLESRVNGGSMTFVANPFYWQPDKPVIPRVIVQVVNTVDQLVESLASGEVDVSTESLSLEQAQQFEATYGTLFDVHYNSGTTAGIMEWNLTSPWFSDKRVRQAFYYGIDREYITKQAMVGTDAVRSPLFAGSTYFKPVLDKYAYDPDTANALLDAAGWTWNIGHTERLLPDSSPAVLTIPYSAGAAFREREVNWIRPMLAKLGITVENGPMDFNAMLDNCTHGTFTVALHGISFSNYDAYGSINQFASSQIPTATNGWQGQNNCRYSSTLMDAAIDKARMAATPSDLVTAYADIQDIFAEDLPCFYLEQRIYPDVVRKGLLGYDHLSSSGVYCNWNVQDWSWASGAVLGQQPVAVAEGSTITVPLTVNITSTTVSDIQLTVASSDPAQVALTGLSAGDLNTAGALAPAMGRVVAPSAGSRAGDVGGTYTLDPATGKVAWTAPTGITGFHTIAFLTFTGIGAPGSSPATVSVGAAVGDSIKTEAGTDVAWRPETVPAFVGWNLAINATGSGSIMKSPNQSLYADGTAVTLIAAPNTGWHFVCWTGAVPDPFDALAAVVTMDADRAVTATFAINTYTLSTGQVGSGSVSKNPSLNPYDYGTVVALTATPAFGYTFTSWSGDVPAGHETDNPLSITMDNNKSVTATFTAIPPGTAAVSLSPVTVQTSGTVTVPLTLTVTSGNVGALQLTVTSSDPTHVALANIVTGDLGGTYTLNPATGTIGWFSLTGITGTHTIASLTFSGAGAAGTTATISVGTAPGDLMADTTGTAVTWSPITAAASVSAVTPGDVDGSGTVTMLDALLAARAAVGIAPLTGSTLQAADVDHSGMVTMLDVLLIARIAVSLST